MTTDGWRDYKGIIPGEVWDEIEDQIYRLESKTRRRLDDPIDPLCLSIRSGASVSMPGVLDSVLNVGITDRTIVTLEQ